jgi:hypothetical protein
LKRERERGGGGFDGSETLNLLLWNAGPYYPLSTIGTVPRACDILKAYEGMEGRKIKKIK